MDSAPSPDLSDTKPSFRKPTNDTANRKYRRHSFANMSDSSSSDGSPKHERNHSPVFFKDRSKMDSSKRKNEDGDSEKQMSVSYRDHRRYDDQNRHQKDVVEEERNYWKSSLSAHESRGGNRFEHTRHESYHNRARESNHSVDRYSRDKSDIDRYSRDKSDTGRHSRDKFDSRTHRSKEVTEYHRHNDRHLSSDRALSGGRSEVSYKDDIRSRERDWYRDRGDRDEKRERQRNQGDYKNDCRTFHEGEGAKGRAKDSRGGKDDSAIYRKETYLSRTKEIDEGVEHKKKHDRDGDKHRDRYSGVQEEEIQNEAKGLSAFYDRDGKGEWIKDKVTDTFEEPSSKKHRLGHLEKPADEDDVKTHASLRQEKETTATVNSDTVGSSSSQAEGNQDFNAAKVAALKAAELVNRNLVGGGVTGFLSTDQKKKLLWGNKKNTSAEESGNRWDLPLFTDRERQEKFNKLMSLRLPWCLWQTVGREGRPEAGEQTRRQGWQPAGGETEGAPAGLGEAIHRRTPETGWQDGWPWPVITTIVTPCTPGVYTSNSLLVLPVWFWWKRPLFGCLCHQLMKSPSFRNHLIHVKQRLGLRSILPHLWTQREEQAGGNGVHACEISAIAASMGFDMKGGGVAVPFMLFQCMDKKTDNSPMERDNLSIMYMRMELVPCRVHPPMCRQRLEFERCSPSGPAIQEAAVVLYTAVI